jgi:hypothetical protein
VEEVNANHRICAIAIPVPYRASWDKVITATLRMSLNNIGDLNYRLIERFRGQRVN